MLSDRELETAVVLYTENEQFAKYVDEQRALMDSKTLSYSTLRLAHKFARYQINLVEQKSVRRI